MNVVSNTSPITNLALSGRLELLEQMYGSVTIPEEVWHELVVKGRICRAHNGLLVL